MRKNLFYFLVLVFCFNARLQAQSNIADSSNKKVFTFVEQMPIYPGGEEKMYKFISKHLKYPEKAKRKKIEGKVLIKFMVNEDGLIENITILKDIGYGCGEAAANVISQMPAWVAGKQNGKSVNVYYTIPFQFSLK
jgi:periplasmic protein TonB